MTHTYLIPQNLDLDVLIKNFSTSKIESFKKEKLLYLIDLLTTIPANNRDLEIVNGYVPIYSQIVRFVIKNYKQYLIYLIDAEVVEPNNSFYPGKSKGYRFTPQYDSLMKPVTIANSIFKKRSKNSKGMSAAQKRKYHYLLRGFNDLLQIDSDAAMNYVEKEYQRKKDRQDLWDKNWKTGELKDPKKQYNVAQKNIASLKTGDFYLTIDKNVHRFHSNLTNVPSALRNFITYDGKQLCAVDAKNSQPFLSLVLFSSSFWQQATNSPNLSSLCSYDKYSSLHIAGTNKSLSPTITLNDVNTKSINKHLDIKRCSSYIMYHQSKEIYTGKELERYINAVTTGRFYEVMQDSIKEQTGVVLTRKEVKELMFLCLYSSNKFYKQVKAEPKRLFRKIFPTVYKLFSIIKETDHSVLPRLLQQVESHLFLNVIAARIAREKPDLLIYTIHDSIVTTVGNENYVKRVIQEELTKAIGFKPSVEVSYWGKKPMIKKQKKVQRLKKAMAA